MTQGLPVSRLINVSVILTPRAAQAPNLNTAIIIGDSDVIDVSERYRSYDDLDSIALAFGVDAPEYKAAALFYGQTPQPTQLFVGRWASADTPGILECGVLSVAQQALANWTAVNDGGFKINIDGGGVTNVTNIDLSGAANLNAVATIITTRMGVAGLAATCEWNALEGRFVFTSTSTGDGSTVSYLTAAAVGDTDISSQLKGTASTASSVIAGIDAEQPVEAYTILDALNFYFYGSTFAATAPISDDQYIAVSAYVEGSNNKHWFGVTSSDAGIITADDEDNIAFKLKALGYRRSGVQYSSSSPYAIASWIGRFVTVNFNGSLTVINMMYQQEPGVAGESLTSAQADAAKANNANVFVNYNNDTTIVQYGTCADGTFFDDLYNTDWLALTIQNNVFNLLYTSGTKVPQTDAGNHLIANAIEAACVQGVQNGTLAPGQWNGPSMGQLVTGQFLPKGYYIYQPPITTQSQGDREARKSVTFQVAAKLAGAVNTVDVVVDVNR